MPLLAYFGVCPACQVQSFGKMPAQVGRQPDVQWPSGEKEAPRKKQTAGAPSPLERDRGLSGRGPLQHRVTLH